MKASLEARLLASVRTAADFRQIKEAGLDEAFEHYGPMHEYIQRMVELHGKVPRLLDLKETFNLPKTVTRSGEEFEFLLREATQIFLVRGVQALLDKNVTEHGDDPDDLIDNLVRDLSGLKKMSSTQLSMTDRSMAARMARYEEKAHEPKAQGIRTGMSFFDEKVKLGWQPGELIGVVGRTYVGKSWMLLFFGLMAWKFDKRVVFVSPEMSIEETEARFDGLLMAQHDIKVEVSQLYRGYVPTDEMKALAAEVAHRKEWITYASADEGRFGLAELGRLIWEHKPDIMIVDGLPLLESGNKRQQIWESIKELSYGLKNLAVRHNLTILISHQATRRAHNVARPPGLHEVAYGDAFVQACDRVLALSRPQHEETTLRVTVQKFRRGRPQQGGIDFDFDPEKGKIHEHIPVDAGEPGSIDSTGEGEGVGDEVSLP